MYCNKFFRTEEEAKAFKKSHGGALYKNIKGSHTRQAYRVEAMMAVQGWLASQHRGGCVPVLRCMEWQAAVGRKGDLSHESIKD